MPIIDRIERSGLTGQVVRVGPAQLQARRSDLSGSRGANFGLTGGLVDEYEIRSGAGTLAGTYIVSLRPYARNGFAATHRDVKEILLLRQVNGVAVPTTPLTVAGRGRPNSSTSILALPAVVANLGDRLFALVALKDASSCRYALAVDFT